MKQIVQKFEKDLRPDVWIGHVGLATNDLEASVDFFRIIGMRIVVSMPQFAILELRGGTHLVLRAENNKVSMPARFDLMVDDLNVMRERLRAAGYKPTAINHTGGPHSSFEVVDPSGILLEFTSSHVSGPV